MEDNTELQERNDNASKDSSTCFLAGFFRDEPNTEYCKLWCVDLATSVPVLLVQESSKCTQACSYLPKSIARVWEHTHVMARSRRRTSQHGTCTHQGHHDAQYHRYSDPKQWPLCDFASHWDHCCLMQGVSACCGSRVCAGPKVLVPPHRQSMRSCPASDLVNWPSPASVC